MSADLQRDPKTYAIIGAAMAVHRELGSWLFRISISGSASGRIKSQPDSFRQRSRNLCLLSRFPFESLLPRQFYCYDNIIIELKALSAISGVEEVQVINYLKATSYVCALVDQFRRSFSSIQTVNTLK